MFSLQTPCTRDLSESESPAPTLLCSKCAELGCGFHFVKVPCWRALHRRGECTTYNGVYEGLGTPLTEKGKDETDEKRERRAQGGPISPPSASAQAARQGWRTESEGVGSLLGTGARPQGTAAGLVVCSRSAEVSAEPAREVEQARRGAHRRKRMRRDQRSCCRSVGWGQRWTSVRKAIERARASRIALRSKGTWRGCRRRPVKSCIR